MKAEYCTTSDGGCLSKQRKVQIHRRLQYCTTPGKLNRSSALCATDSLWQKGQILFSPGTSREHIFLNACLQRFCFSDVENTRDCTDRVFTRYQPKGILGVPARLMFSYFRDKTDRLLTDLTSGVQLLVFFKLLEEGVKQSWKMILTAISTKSDSSPVEILHQFSFIAKREIRTMKLKRNQGLAVIIVHYWLRETKSRFFKQFY